MNPETWVATGHVAGFSDPLIDCKDCKTRHRADKLVEEWSHSQGKDIVADGWTDEQLVDYINDNKIEELDVKFIVSKGGEHALMAGLKTVQISDALIMKWIPKRVVPGQPAADPVTENAVPKDI